MKIRTSILLQIVMYSIIIGIVYNLLNPKGLSFIREARQINWVNDSTTNDLNNSISADNSEHNFPNDAQNGFTKPEAIKVDLAYKLFLEGKKFIDARPADEYKESHIRGAINIPFYGSENYESILNQISKDEMIVTYCSGDDCDLSILLGDELFAKGYKKVYVFFGGWNDWLKMGYPIERKQNEK